jgi:hypothetical protein
MSDETCRVCGELALAFDFHVSTRYAGGKRSYRLRLCWHCREILECILGESVIRFGSPRPPTSPKVRLAVVG